MCSIIYVQGLPERILYVNHWVSLSLSRQTQHRSRAWIWSHLSGWRRRWRWWRRGRWRRENILCHASENLTHKALSRAEIYSDMSALRQCWTRWDAKPWRLALNLTSWWLVSGTLLWPKKKFKQDMSSLHLNRKIQIHQSWFRIVHWNFDFQTTCITARSKWLHTSCFLYAQSVNFNSFSLMSIVQMGMI